MTKSTSSLKSDAVGSTKGKEKEMIYLTVDRNGGCTIWAGGQPEYDEKQGQWVNCMTVDTIFRNLDVAALDGLAIPRRGEIVELLPREARYEDLLVKCPHFDVDENSKAVCDWAPPGKDKRAEAIVNSKLGSMRARVCGGEHTECMWSLAGYEVPANE